MSDIEIIDREEGLAALREDWSRLLHLTPRASYFQSWEWFNERWKHRSETDNGLRIVVEKDRKEVIGIVPLIIQTRPTAFGAVKKLRFAIDNWGSFYGPISATPALTLENAQRFLTEPMSAKRYGFDLLEFTNLPPLPVGAQPFGNPLEGAETSECSHVATLTLKGDWESYWDSRKTQKNRRRNVERCERRLSEMGNLRFLRYTPAPGEDPNWELYEQCEQLASRSWQDGLVDGYTLHHEPVRNFLRDVHRASCETGNCDLALLYLDDAPIAFSYGYRYRGYVDLMRVGFDPEWSKFAPGNALWTRLIRESFERGDQLLDFGPSCLDYKRFWMTEVETSHQIVSYASTPSARAFRLARKLRHHLPARSADHTNQEAKKLAAKHASTH